MQTLEEARQALHERLKKARGTRCPCCGRTVRRYHRALNASMAEALRWLVDEFQQIGDWIHVPTSAPRWLVSKGGSLAYLRHWDLVITNPRRLGEWMPTTRGKAFVRGQIVVPKYAVTLSGHLTEFDGPEISIGDVLADWVPPETPQILRSQAL